MKLSSTVLLFIFVCRGNALAQFPDDVQARWNTVAGKLKVEGVANSRNQEFQASAKATRETVDALLKADKPLSPERAYVVASEIDALARVSKDINVRKPTASETVLMQKFESELTLTYWEHGVGPHGEHPDLSPRQLQTVYKQRLAVLGSVTDSAQFRQLVPESKSRKILHDDIQYVAAKIQLLTSADVKVSKSGRAAVQAQLRSLDGVYDHANKAALTKSDVGGLEGILAGLRKFFDFTAVTKTDLVAVTVRTRSLGSGTEVNGCDVKFALVGVWETGGKEVSSFDQRSSPTTQSVPAGAYYFWAIKNTKEGPKKRVEPGEDLKLMKSVDVDAP